MGGANNTPAGGSHIGWGGKGTNQSTGYNPQSTMSYNAPTQQMLYAPSTPIPQNVQAKYAPQQNYRNTPMSIPAPAPTANSGGFNLGDIGSILNSLFGMGGQPGRGFPIQPTTNQAPQTQGNAGYIQQPVLPSMVDPQSITSNAPAPVVNRARQFTYTPPPPPPAAAPAPEAPPDPALAPGSTTPARNDDYGTYNASGEKLQWDEGQGWRVYRPSDKRGGAVKKLTDNVDRALRVVRNVVEKDKK